MAAVSFQNWYKDHATREYCSDVHCGFRLSYGIGNGERVGMDVDGGSYTSYENRFDPYYEFTAEIYGLDKSGKKTVYAKKEYAEQGRLYLHYPLEEVEDSRFTPLFEFMVDRELEDLAQDDEDIVVQLVTKLVDENSEENSDDENSDA